jgi:hypothetical protein
VASEPVVSMLAWKKPALRICLRRVVKNTNIGSAVHSLKTHIRMGFFPKFNLFRQKPFIRRLIMNHLQKHFSASLIALAALFSAAPMAWAATAPSLGAASSFAALSGAGLTCTGSAIVGDVGSLLSVTGFPGFPAVLCTITGGTVHAADSTAIAAHTALFGASGTDSQLTAQACDHTFDGVTELSGLLIDNTGVTVNQPLSPGVYCFSSAATLGGTLNLTGGGVYIFRTGSTLTTGATSPAMAQVLVNGQLNCGSGVFWQIGSSATIGSNTAFVGDILANASITFTGVNTSLVGGAFANVAAVTMTGTSITTCGGPLPPPPPPTACDSDNDGNDGHHDGHDGDNDGHDGHHDGHDKEHCDNGHHNGHDKDHEKCNQGVGNGPEGCDPGNSNLHNPFGSNDEHGGTKGNPGRKGGNK